MHFVDGLVANTRGPKNAHQIVNMTWDYDTVPSTTYPLVYAYQIERKNLCRVSPLKMLKLFYA